jgi:hypothetical protein
MAGPSVDHQHGGLYGAGAEPVQGLLAGLKVDTAERVCRPWMIEAFLDECRGDSWLQSHPDLVDRLEGVLTNLYLGGDGPQWQVIWDQVRSILARTSDTPVGPCQALAEALQSVLPPGKTTLGNRAHCQKRSSNVEFRSAAENSFELRGRWRTHLIVAQCCGGSRQSQAAACQSASPIAFLRAGPTTKSSPRSPFAQLPRMPQNLAGP